MVGGAQATDDLQPTDPAPSDRLGLRQVRTISTDSKGNTIIEVCTILDSHRRPGVPPGKRIILEYNASFQPVGFSAVRFRRMTGDIIRSGNFVRIPDDWSKAYFFVPPEYNLEAVKDEAFRDMGSKLRTWRHDLKKICVITEEDTPDTIREYAAKMKTLRALNDSPHCTGSKSYARLTHEEAERLGHQPTRAQNYVRSHTKKNGSYPNDIVKERCEQMKELIPTDPTASSSITEGTVRWAPNDAFDQAIGNKPEYASRVRMAGPNILPVRGTIRSYYTPSQQVAEQMAENNARIARQVAEQEAERQARFDARFRQLEELMRLYTPPDSASPPVAMVRSSVDSGSGNVHRREDAMDVNDR
ncbi:uncharacterized protein LOC132174413 [Corylus avellana]|uniref:uncharacterized protein LOC132174413 n=1 Tax=Corylus avellana TaxID=13451 RepID=UPI00286C0D8D|nr:uncharacterized protein LOC132174413 [Corylus avellana]